MYIHYAIVFISLFAGTQTRIYDITTIYRIEDNNLLYDDTIDYDENDCMRVTNAELHARTNAIPVTVFDEDGTIMSTPNSGSSFPNPPLGWTLQGWTPTSEDYVVSEPSILLKNIEMGGCQYIISKTENDFFNETLASISVKPSKKTEDIIIPDTNGEDLETSWNIRAPSDQRIRVEYKQFDVPNSSNDFWESVIESNLKFYDGDSNESPVAESYTLSSDSTVQGVVSSGSSMYITYSGKISSADTEVPFTASYVLESKNQMTLVEDSGILTSPPFLITSNKICVATLYQVSGYKDWLHMKAYIKSRDGYQLNLGQVEAEEENKWLYQRFQADVPDYFLDQEARVFLLAEKHQDTKLYIRKIEECIADELENVIILNKSISLPQFHNEVESSDEFQGRCINGGMPSKNENICICPPGFTGAFCEDGCGSNKYGEDCGGRCSNFRKGCKGLILCKEEVGCNCAPGYRGKLCQDPCDHGTYGSGCYQKCDHCDGDESCDPFTGICNYGCKPGFFPPLCYYKYKYLSTPPILVPRGTDTIDIVFSTTYIFGRGTPKFYQIEFKKSEDTEWTAQDSFLLPHDENVQATINNLEVFTEYDVRVILIDADLNSYTGDDIPYATGRTECIVPNYINYELCNDSITPHSLEISWTYESEDSWCPTEKFEVYIKDGWHWVLYAHTTDNFINITDLDPGRIHKMRIRAVAKNGKAPFSKVYSFRTDDEAPSSVVYLRKYGSRSNEIWITWDTPRYTAGDIKHYIVKYKCQKLMACSNIDCSYSAGELTTHSKSYKIRGLIPFAQYLISVSAVSELPGSETFLYAATDQREPDIAPDVLLPNVTQRTDTSITIQWKKMENCTKLNGFLYKYRYEILSEDAHENYMLGSRSTGLTANTTKTFTNLTPDRRYSFKIFYVTSAGYNPRRPLIIHAKTRQSDKGSREEIIPEVKLENISNDVNNRDRKLKKPNIRRCHCDTEETDNTGSSEELSTTSSTTPLYFGREWEYLDDSSSKEKKSVEETSVDDIL